MEKQHIRGRTRRTKLPRLTFTPEQLAVLGKTLVPFEQMILTQKNPLPSSDLALETVKQVQAKIQRMMTSSAWGELVAFDANEMLILQACVRIFAISLESREQSAERNRLKRQCQILSSLLKQ